MSNDLNISSLIKLFCVNIQLYVESVSHVLEGNVYAAVDGQYHYSKPPFPYHCLQEIRKRIFTRQ